MTPTFKIYKNDSKLPAIVTSLDDYVIAAGTKYLRVEMYDENNKLLDRETIPVITDGKDSAADDDAVIGYIKSKFTNTKGKTEATVIDGSWITTGTLESDRLVAKIAVMTPMLTNGYYLADDVGDRKLYMPTTYATLSHTTGYYGSPGDILSGHAKFYGGGIPGSGDEIDSYGYDRKFGRLRKRLPGEKVEFVLKGQFNVAWMSFTSYNVNDEGTQVVDWNGVLHYGNDKALQISGDIYHVHGFGMGHYSRGGDASIDFVNSEYAWRGSYCRYPPMMSIYYKIRKHSTVDGSIISSSEWKIARQFDSFGSNTNSYGGKVLDEGMGACATVQTLANADSLIDIDEVFEIDLADDESIDFAIRPLIHYSDVCYATRIDTPTPKPGFVGDVNKAIIYGGVAGVDTNRSMVLRRGAFYDYSAENFGDFSIFKPWEDRTTSPKIFSGKLKISVDNYIS